MYTQNVADFIQNIDYVNLPDTVKKMAILCFIDWLGCVLKAKEQNISNAVLSVVKNQGGNNQSTLLGYWERNSAINASFVNGTMAHTIEFDDIFKEGVYHPAAPVIASALAVAEMEGASGQSLIEGIVSGYEVSTRIAETVSPSHYEYWHTTGTCGTFGAAAAAAKILKLSTKETINALGLAGTQAAGLWECAEGSPECKPFHPGKAAMNGVLAALISKKGVNAGETTLEGRKGFCRAMSNEDKLETLTRGLNRDFYILKNTFRFYPSCGHNHSALDALFYLLDKYNFEKRDLEKIIVRTHKTACRVAGVNNPSNMNEAKFSIYFTLALALKYQKVTLDSFSEKNLEDPEIHTIMDLIDLIGDDEMQQEFPKKRTAEVSIVLKNGDMYTKRVDFRKGDPENPLTIDELTTKFRDLASNVLNDKQIDNMLENIFKLENVKDVNNLFKEYL